MFEGTTKSVQPQEGPVVKFSAERRGVVAAHIEKGSGVHARGAHAAEAHSILEAAGAKFFPKAPTPGSDE